MSYTVTLVDLPNVADADRQAMEQTFRHTIEQVLGGPDGVAAAWRACEVARQAEKNSTVTVPQLTLGGPISRWDLMHAMATRAAFEAWQGTPGDARFIVKA
ncbi:MAG: hypothetical protein AB7P37_15620 [Ramlibacter sp.]